MKHLKSVALYHYSCMLSKSNAASVFCFNGKGTVTPHTFQRHVIYSVRLLANIVSFYWRHTVLHVLFIVRIYKVLCVRTVCTSVWI